MTPPAAVPHAQVGTRTRAITRAAKHLLTPSNLTGVALEAAWNAAHLALYPFGVASERRREFDAYGTHHLRPEQRALMVGDIAAAGTPILLLHGMVDNRSIFTLLRGSLRRRGFARVPTLNYSPFTRDVRGAAHILADTVADLLDATGYEQLHIIGHSLGGLIARYYVQCLGGHQFVHTLVTLGTPHQGSVVAELGFGSLVRQLRPGSDLVAELNAPAPGVATTFRCYWSDLDHLVLPSRNARIVHPDLDVTNVLVRSVGHMSLPIQPRLIHDIVTALHQLSPAADLLPADTTT